MTAEAVRAEARALLERCGALPDAPLDIAEAALAFARIDLPDEPPGPARAHLAALAAEVLPYAVCDGGEERAQALRGLLAGKHGYAGDRETYDDPANANLLRVIARRRGLPVALGVVWLHTAAAAGFDAWGIDFPGHFLLGVGGEDGAVVVDAFDGGMIRDRDELEALLRRAEGPRASLERQHLRRMTARQVLLRLQNNLRLRRAAAGDLAGALSAAEDMLRLAPDAAPLWHDAALLAERLERPRAALAAWERLAALGAAGTEEAIERLRRRLN